ncbi:MAG: helix-turn-helix domain-containing protein [Nanoarchaeota archaeon]|nr:helix-turn-helix domain-containing protein [Nanoarchaeota archaeon]
MSITDEQKHQLKKFIKELSVHRGRHTELVSVYIPEGYDIVKIIQHLTQESGTATNIKDASTRKNVIDALERMIQHLRIYKKTPPNGLAAFSGNIAAQEGKQDFKVWSIEPPIPLRTRIYKCDKTFVLDILEGMMETKEVYGLIVMDRRDADIAYLKGKTIIHLQKTHSEVPGKIKAGGQCLVKDSLIQLSDGSLPRIEIVHNPHVVNSVMFKNNFAIRNSNITDKWEVKKNKVYKIITKYPRLEVQSSKDHIFFAATNDGIVEKSAEELKEGDFLIMPEKISVVGKAQKLNPKKYYNSFIITREGQNLLKEKRKAKGLLQKELANKIGLEQTTISYYEIGRLNASKEPLKRLCSELGIDFEQFLEKYTNAMHHQNTAIRLPSEINGEFAQFLGYFMGDGCIEPDRITLFEQNKQAALDYKKRFDSFFNLSSSYKFRAGKNYHQIRFTSRPLSRLIKEEFPDLKKKLDSEIPTKILQSKDKVVAAFLRGLFDAEGYVHNKRGVALGINNKKLAKSVQLVLLRFSILSSLQEYDNRANIYSNNPRFTVDIVEKKSVELFKKHIGFTSHEKIKKLNETLAGKSNKDSIRQIIVPGKRVREIIEKAGYSIRLFPKVSGFFLNKRMMSKQTFKDSILANIQDKGLYLRLDEIYNYPILPVKVHKIERMNKSVEMIDISVKNQNFIANGVIVHNSAKRFAKNTELAAKAHYKKVADYVKDQFLGNKDLKGIIVGGPGPTKYAFIDGGYITTEVRNKIIGIKDLSYTGDFGLQELVDKSEDILAKEGVIEEKKTMNHFFGLLAKNPGIVSYGEAEVMNNLKNGAVATLLLSDVLEDEKIEEFENEAKLYGTEVKLISTETMEGAQLRDIGKIAAILRYEVK